MFVGKNVFRLINVDETSLILFVDNLARITDGFLGIVRFINSVPFSSTLIRGVDGGGGVWVEVGEV